MSCQQSGGMDWPSPQECVFPVVSANPNRPYRRGDKQVAEYTHLLLGRMPVVNKQFWSFHWDYLPTPRFQWPIDLYLAESPAYIGKLLAFLRRQKCDFDVSVEELVSGLFWPREIRKQLLLRTKHNCCLADVEAAAAANCRHLGNIPQKQEIESILARSQPAAYGDNVYMSNFKSSPGPQVTSAPTRSDSNHSVRCAPNKFESRPQPETDMVPTGQPRFPPNEKHQPDPTSQAQYSQAQYSQAQYSQPRYSQPQYSQPQYSQPQYSQSRYSKPQYSQPQYSQPRYSQPPSQYSRPQYSRPPSQYSQPQSQYSQPQYSPPQSQYSPPQSQYSPPPSQYSQPQYSPPPSHLYPPQAPNSPPYSQPQPSPPYSRQRNDNVSEHSFVKHTSAQTWRPPKHSTAVSPDWVEQWVDTAIKCSLPSHWSPLHMDNARDFMMWEVTQNHIGDIYFSQAWILMHMGLRPFQSAASEELKRDDSDSVVCKHPKCGTNRIPALPSYFYSAKEWSNLIEKVGGKLSTLHTRVHNKLNDQVCFTLCLIHKLNDQVCFTLCFDYRQTRMVFW